MLVPDLVRLLFLLVIYYYSVFRLCYIHNADYDISNWFPLIQLLAWPCSSLFFQQFTAGLSWYRLLSPSQSWWSLRPMIWSIIGLRMIRFWSLVFPNFPSKAIIQSERRILDIDYIPTLIYLSFRFQCYYEPVKLIGLFYILIEHLCGDGKSMFRNSTIIIIWTLIFRCIPHRPCLAMNTMSSFVLWLHPKQSLPLDYLRFSLQGLL